MSGVDILLLALIALGAFFALRRVLRQKGGCSGSCQGCPRSGSCKKSSGK